MHIMLSAFVAHRSSYTTTTDSYSFLVQRSAFPSSLLSLATLTQETLGCGDERKSGESERETKFRGGGVRISSQTLSVSY